MKKIIKIQDLVPPTGQEYYGASYPGPGLYRNPTTSEWYLAYLLGPALTVIGLGKGFACPIPVEDYVEPQLEQAAGGIQASDLLKAIAITQKPEMAKELLK